MRSFGVFFVFLLLLSPLAQGQELVRVIAGGPSTLQRLNPYRADLDKAAGTKVEISVNPSEVAIRSLVNGLADLVVVGEPEASFARAEKKGLPKQNLADYQWYENPPAELQVGVHPDNQAKELSKAQISDILSGKITNWQKLGGADLPITVYVAESYQSTMESVFEHYLEKKSSPVVKFLKNRDGMLRALQREPGAMAFFTNKDSLGDFKPKFFSTDIKRRSFVIAKKTIRPEGKKVYDHIKTLKFDRD